MDVSAGTYFTCFTGTKVLLLTHLVDAGPADGGLKEDKDDADGVSVTGVCVCLCVSVCVCVWTSDEHQQSLCSARSMEAGACINDGNPNS